MFRVRRYRGDPKGFASGRGRFDGECQDCRPSGSPPAVRHDDDEHGQDAGDRGHGEGGRGYWRCHLERGRRLDSQDEGACDGYGCSGGSLTRQPKVVSETEDAELKALMEQFEQANMDVAGDDDSEEDE